MYVCVVMFYRLEQLTAIDIWAIASLYSEKFQNFRISAQIFFFSLSSAISTEGNIHKFSQGPSHTQRTAHSTAYSRAYSSAHSTAQRKNWKFFSDANGQSSETPALLPVQGIATEKLCLSLAVRSLCALAPSQYKVSIGPCAVCSYVLGGGCLNSVLCGTPQFLCVLYEVGVGFLRWQWCVAGNSLSSFPILAGNPALPSIHFAGLPAKCNTRNPLIYNIPLL